MAKDHPAQFPGIHRAKSIREEVREALNQIEGLESYALVMTDKDGWFSYGMEVTEDPVVLSKMLGELSRISHRINLILDKLKDEE